MPEASVLIVGTNAAAVEGDLAAGRLACPICEGVLQRWGHARKRILHRLRATEWLRPRRGICAACGTTHVLLPEDTLLRRRDDVGVIGAALAAKAAARDTGASPPISAESRRRCGAGSAVSLPVSRSSGPTSPDGPTPLTPMLGPVVPTGSAFADAVEAIGVAARAAAHRLGPRPPWSLASVLTGGALLATRNDLWAPPG